MNIKFSSLFDNKRVLMVFSLIISLVLWLFVALFIDSTQPLTIQDKEVDISKQTTVLDPLNLSIVGGANFKVNVQIEGERYIVGGIVPDDITITADLSGISSTGTYEVRLNGTDRTGKGFDVIKITPPTAKIKIDRVITKKFPITAQIDGLVIPNDYIVEETYLNPKELVITGPENDVLLIDRCIVHAKFSSPLTNTTVTKSDIVLYNKEGEVIQNDSLIMDIEQADITIPVLKIVKLPVKIGFLNVPGNFPIEELEYHMSSTTIDVAGPVDAIENYTEVMAGYIDIKYLQLGGVYAFNIELPNGFSNIENVQVVTITVDTSKMADKLFNVSNIRIANPPFAYDVELVTDVINNVHMIGLEDIIADLTAEDIVATIDLATITSSREFVEGNVQIPVTISVPTKGLVWANWSAGGYSAVVNFTAKQASEMVTE